MAKVGKWLGKRAKEKSTYIGLATILAMLGTPAGATVALTLGNHVPELIAVLGGVLAGASTKPE